jgi:hypothetical protein
MVQWTISSDERRELGRAASLSQLVQAMMTDDEINLAWSRSVAELAADALS